MIAGTPVLDLDDAASLEAADMGGVLRSAASGGAQVRATAAAVNEDALSRLTGLRPRSVVLVSGSGRAAHAARVLVAALGNRASMPLVPVTALPPWVGPLDVVLVAGDDAADPNLIDAVALAVRRGAEVVVAAPYEGPLRAAAAGRTALLEPRVPVLGHNRLLRFLAAGIAVLRIVDPSRIDPSVPDLTELSDVLDAEALRDGPHNEVFRNPAKIIATQMRQRALVLAGDTPAATELAEHGAEVLLAAAGRIASAVDLAEAIAANPRMVATAGEPAPDFDPLFHDEELDGPVTVERIRVLVLSTAVDSASVRRKLTVFGGAGAGIVDAELVRADLDMLHSSFSDPAAPPMEVGTAPPGERGRSTEIEQLAVLALRLEMAAAYGGLIGSGLGEPNSAATDGASQYGGRN